MLQGKNDFTWPVDALAEGKISVVWCSPKELELKYWLLDTAVSIAFPHPCFRAEGVWQLRDDSVFLPFPLIGTSNEIFYFPCRTTWLKLVSALYIKRE